MAKKKKQKKENIRFIIDESDDNTIEIDIREKGKIVGTIVAQDYELHRLLLESQRDAMEAGQKDMSAYLPFYAALIEQHHGVKVNNRTAYRIANIACDAILDLKKSTDG